MKILHTSDWHLGRALFQESLLEDQCFALDQIVGMVKDSRPDVLLISGDIYDRAVPSKEAVALLDGTLRQIVGDLKVPVVMIAGNHDSPERLGFAQELLRGQGLHIVGPLPEGTPYIPFTDQHGEVRVYPLPYADPPEVRSCWGMDEVRTHQQVLEAQMARVRMDLPAGTRAVVMAHAFVGGASVSESEEDLSVGGSSLVEASVFEGMAYVALGHLHRPQRAGGDHIRYSGSLLKYSFSEADHAKGVTLVELAGPGVVTTTHLALTPRRDVRILEGAFDAFLGTGNFGNREDYLLLRLHDREPVVDAINRLRQVFPNVLSLDWPKRGGTGDISVPEVNPRNASPETLFQDFFQEITGAPWDEAQKTAFLDIAGDLARVEREA